MAQVGGQAQKVSTEGTTVLTDFEPLAFSALPEHDGPVYICGKKKCCKKYRKPKKKRCKKCPDSN